MAGTGGFYPPAFWEPAFWQEATSTSLVVNAWWAIQMEFAGVGNGWTDVTYDVRSEESVKMTYGMAGVTATDRVASTGTLQFTMNNGPTNTARTVGYYAPDNTSCRSGFNYGIRVRLALTYTPIGTVYRFLGTLDQIRPTPGVRGRYLTRCMVVDWIDEAARYHITGLDLETSVRGDQVFSTVVASMPMQPASVQTTPGLDTYPYALDNVRDEQTTTLRIFQELALSELGYIYIKSDTNVGGTLTYESRSVRGSNNIAIQTFSNTMDEIAVERNRANLLNKVQVTAHPRRVDAAATTVLFTLNTVSAVQPFTTLALNAPFRDPNQPLARVGGVNLQTPTAVTDYTANTLADGTGTDLTGLFSVTLSDSSGNSATFAIANNSSFTGYLTKLQLRGRGIYDYNTTILSSENTQSQANFGQRVINLDMPYQADPSVANEASQYVLNVWSSPLSYITKLTVLGNWRDALMQAVLLRDISDCVALDETVTGMKSTTRYFVNAVTLDISQGRVFRLSLLLAPADQNSYWLLEIPGSSELGVTTRLGFGLILGHVDVAHGDSHDDVAFADVAHVDTHGDIAHVDVAHSDSVHVDTAHADVAHADVAHADSTHTDVTHVDTAFSDAHGDITHADTTHADTAHSDSHGDSAHSDVTHADVAHVDSHSDAVHGDVTNEHDDHDDSSEGSFFTHIDFTDHADIAHQDTHNDTAHSDTAFADTAHSDAHGDTNHGDVAHIDAAHTDSHTDVAHGDVTHADAGHTDSVHADSAHTDTAHVDTAHGDIAHIDGPAHTDTHTDSAHSDTVHSDVHTDVSHGDRN